MKFIYLLISILVLISCGEKQINSSEIKSNDFYNPEEKLEILGIKLPKVSAPVANYVRAVRTGNLLFLSGSGPKKEDGTYITGKVGDDLTIEEGYIAARVTGINHLATLKSELGDLKKSQKNCKSFRNGKF